jgi:hypothetical protein
MCSKVTTDFQRALQGKVLEESLLFEALIKMCHYLDLTSASMSK